MEKVILVTGFGPFGQHKINASWEAVKLLGEDNIKGCRIITVEVPVTYRFIEENVPQLWKQYNPHLVVHVGVSKYADAITLETRAYRSGYQKTDCDGCCHPTGEICDADSGEECIMTSINVDATCNELNDDRIAFKKSSDAGRYLCEYIYYKSLHINSDRTLFIHVPDLNKPYSASELAEGLLKAIKCILKEMEQ